MRPDRPEQGADECDAGFAARWAQYEVAAAAWDAVYEAAQQLVGRIAYVGKVPVNIMDAGPGDYIVPVAGPDDTIAAKIVSATSVDFAQHRVAVGQVRRVLPDGRAEIVVRVG